MLSPARVAAAFKSKKKVKSPDGTERIVYEYSEAHGRKKDKEKAQRVESLRKKLPDLRKSYRAALKSEDPSERLVALAVGLIDATYERVGNDGSAKEGHFGVTGWQKKHISFSGGKATLKYTGKSGVEQEKVVSDKRLVDALKEAVKGKKPGDRILCEGDECRATPAKVNSYLKEFGVTAKDLRGLHANEEMKSHLARVRKKGPKLPSDKKEREKLLKEEFKEALEAAAGAVGHTPSMLRGSYLVPGLEDEFMSKGSVGKSLKKAGDMAKSDDQLYRSLVQRYQAQRWEVLPEDEAEVLYDRFYPASAARVAARWARVSLPEGRWVDVSPSDLDSEQKKTVWDLYSLSYGKIGKHIPSLGALLAKYQALRLIDIDGDEDIDAFLGYKKTPFGNKLAVIGTDGSRKAKSEAVRHMVRLSKTPGWYGEASHAIERVMLSGGVPQVMDEDIIAQILRGKEFRFVGGGRYERKLGGMGWVEKALYGNPKVSRAAKKTRSEKEDEEAEDLIKPSPKKKPPRNDLRKRPSADDSDDPDKKQDKKDRSRNYKDAVSSWRVAWRWARKGPEMVPAKRKQDGQVVMVSPDTLRDSNEYEEIDENSGETTPEPPDPVQQEKALRDGIKKKFEGKLDQEDVEALLEDVSTPEEAQAVEEILTEMVAEAEAKKQEEAARAEKERVTKETIDEISSLDKGIAKGLSDLDEGAQEALLQEFADEKKSIARTPPKDPAKFSKKIDSDRKLAADPEADPKERGAALARVQYFDAVLDNPAVDPDNPIPDSGSPLEGYDLQEAKEEAVVRARSAVAKYRELPAEDRARHLDRLDSEIEGLEEGDPRRVQLEALRRGIGVAGVLADGDKATGVGSSFARLVRSAEKTGNLDKILEAGGLGSEEPIVGGTQAMIRSVYEDLEPEEFADIIPEDSPGRKIADLLAKGNPNMSEEDVALMKQILVDTMVAETAFLDPAVTRDLGPKATVKEHREEAKKARASAVPKRQMPDVEEPKSVIDWFAEFIRNLSKNSNSGSPKKAGWELEWDFTPWS